MIRSGIYIIETTHTGGKGKCIKIGMSKDIPTRLRHYTTAMGSNFIVYYYYLVPEPIDQVFRVEKLLHEHFDIFHISDDSAKELFDVAALNEDMPLISFPESSQCFRPIPINLPLITALNVFDPIKSTLDGGASIDYWKTRRSEAFYNPALVPPTRTLDALLTKLCTEDTEMGLTMAYVVKKLSDSIGYDTDKTTIYTKEINKARRTVKYRQYPFTKKMRELAKFKPTIRISQRGKEILKRVPISTILSNYPDVFEYTIHITHLPPPKSSRNILTLKPWRTEPISMDDYFEPRTTIDIIKNQLISNTSAVAGSAWFNRFIYWLNTVIFFDGPVDRSLVFFGLRDDGGRELGNCLLASLLGELNVQTTASHRAAITFVSGDHSRLSNDNGFSHRAVVIRCDSVKELNEYRDDSDFIISPHTAVIFTVADKPISIDTYRDEYAPTIGGKRTMIFDSPSSARAQRITETDKDAITQERFNFARFILIRGAELRNKFGIDSDLGSAAIYESCIPFVTIACSAIINIRGTKK